MFTQSTNLSGTLIPKNNVEGIMLYPIKFTSVYKSKIWGGSKLNEIYSRQIPATDIGEAWEISCRDDGMCTVANGPLQGMPFDRLIETYGAAIYGNIKISDGKFPLLIKLLDVNTDLSVQVHPSKAFIDENGLDGEEEKNEVWYVLNAEDNASIVSGLKQGVTFDKLKNAIDEGRVESCLERTAVKSGDVVMIRTGSVHAACSGMLLFELQQSSDTTYRLYDYNRRDSAGNLRRLDVEKALGAINYEGGAELVEKPEFTSKSGSKWRRLAKCDSFCLDEIELDGLLRIKGNKNFGIFTVIKGNATVRGNSVSVNVGEGESIFIPACLDKYVITGSCTLLHSGIKPPVSWA